ncbi:MAG: hypothetical protein JWM87_4090 [Candidatus Eremiobacteraeota bacterium]|nr:hypothetical protein [Candidatus Eremiobacteraeota bacterium]
MRAAAAMAVLFALAASPAPAPLPSAGAEPPAVAAPPGAPLPEIGRTRATSPACAAMRDIVVPAFAAARRADMRFEDTRKRLVRYATFASDNGTHIGARRDVDDGAVFREGELARLDTDASRLLQEAQTIRKLMEDPRLAPDSKDPLVQAERAQLGQVYDQQQRRAALLAEFVQRESMSANKNLVGMGNDRGIASRDGKFAKDPDPTPQSAPPPPSAAPGMPALSGFDVADRSRLGEWGDRAALAVRASENQAAKAFLGIAKACS